MKDSDEKYLTLAVRLARRGLGQTGSNPPVGCVIVSDKENSCAPVIVGCGLTQPGGRPHAEAVALKQAGLKARHGTLYTTLDPCTHQGQSPPCSSAIIDAGIKRVVSLSFDNNPDVAGQSEEQLQMAGIKFDRVSGSLKKKADYLNLGHKLRIAQQRPFVQLKLAVGSDERVAQGDGKPVWVTSPLSRQIGHLMRSESGAILIGRRTAEADNPDLTCRLPGLECRSPARIVLDSELRISVSSNLVRSAGKTPLWIFHSEKADVDKTRSLKDLNVELSTCRESSDGSGLDLSDFMKSMFKKGITRLLVEGGPSVFQSFVESGYFDEIIIFKGPNPAGASGLLPLNGVGLEIFSNTEQFVCLETRSFGDDIMTRILNKKVLDDIH